MSLVTQALRGLAEPGLPGKEAGELEEETEGLALVGSKGAVDQGAELEPMAVAPEHHRKASSQRGIPMAQVQGTHEDLLERWDIGASLHFSGHQQGGAKSRQPGADLDILGLGKMARMIGREKPFQKAGVW
jgi:hypothetical protein